MNFLIEKLPGREYFKPIENKSASKWYKFEDVECDRVRIFSHVPDPWVQNKRLLLMPEIAKGKSDNTTYPLRLNLKLFYCQNDDGMTRLNLYREYYKGYFPHMAEPSVMFDAFPLKLGAGELPLWLIYSIPLGEKTFFVK